MARSAAIFGITGSTARENSVEGKIHRLTILRTGGMAKSHGWRRSAPGSNGAALAFGQLVELHQARKKRLQILERNHIWTVGRRAIGVLVGLDEDAGNADRDGRSRQHRHVVALAARC